MLITEDELEIARLAVEDVLIKYRDGRISQPLHGNGLVVRERDGGASAIIRLTISDAIRIGLDAVEKSRAR